MQQVQAQKRIHPKLCVLTQSATALPAYYREFFKDFDLFFITFKQENPEALAFLPGSTMHEGRNYMWEHVKGKYDYYLFIDDDQVFHELKPYVPLATEAFLTKVQNWIPSAPGVRLLDRAKHHRFAKRLYRKIDSARFKELLFQKIETYQPMVASVRTLHSDRADAQDRYALRRNRRVRRLTWFDAQVTLFSEMGARLIMPYLAGWFSPQVPTYCLSNLAFKDKAIYILDMAASNDNHLSYRDDFDSRKELRDVTAWLSPGLLDRSCGPLFDQDDDFINHEFASETSKGEVPAGTPPPATMEEVLTRLSASFDLHHPYIYERHKDVVDALDAKMGGTLAETVHG